MPFTTNDPEITPEELQSMGAFKVRPTAPKTRTPFTTDDPEVALFTTDDPEVSPEELQTTEAVKARLEAQKSRLDPLAYVKGAVQGVSDFAEQVQGSQKELGARVAARGVPQTLGDAASLGLSAFGGPGSLTANIAGRALGEDLPKVAFEAALRGASDLGQIGKDVAQSQVLDPYRVVRQAVQDEGFLPATKKLLANAPQLLAPSMDRTAALLQVFPTQAAEIIRQAHQRAAQQAQERESLQKGGRSQLGEVATALASQFTEDPLLAEEIGKAVSPSKDLAQTTDLASNLADPSVLESRLVKLGTRIGSRVAPTLTKQMSTPILELGGKAAKVAAAEDAKGRLAEMVGNNKQAWEEAVQRSDVSAPPLQTPPRQLFAPSEVQQAKQLFSERAAQAGQKSPGLVQKGVGAAGQVAEKGGKAVENVTGKIDELAEKYEGPLSLASTVAGASGGTLGALAGSQLPGAVRKVVKWSQNASRAGTALRSIANTDWGSSIPIWRQIAKDPDAPQWLVRGVTVNVAGKLKAGELVENSLQVGGDLGKGLLEGAATDAVLTAADTSKSGEEIGGEAGTGGLFGVLGTAPALKPMSNQRKALAFSYDSMRKASESIAAGADPLVIAATPDATMHSSVILEQMFRGVLPGRKDLKVDLMDGAQFTQVSNDPAAAAFYDETTGHIAVNLESVDADGRQLHEAGHALMASLAASNPAIIQHFRQLLGADGLSRARQDYQQALGRSVPEDDTFIVGELFSEALANGLRGANLNEALPAVLGRTQTQSFFRDPDVRRALKDPATLNLVRQQFQSAAEFRPAVDMEKEPGVRLRAAQAGNHPALPTETRTDGTQGNDFVDVTNGQVRETPVPVVRARVRNRRREVLALFPDVPPSGNTNPQASNVGVREGPSGLNEKTGNRLGDQFYATARSFGEGTKNMLRRVEQAIANNETLAGWYQQIGQGDGWAASVRESLGAVEAQYKDFIPFAFKVDKQGNLLVQNYSLTALERKANQWAGRKGLLSLDLWNGDLGTFRQDVQTYLKNHAEGRPGSDGLGENKRNLLNVFLVGGNRTFEALNPLRVQAQGRDRQGIVRSYRADRLQTVEPSDVGGFVKPDYNKQVRNLSPQITDDLRARKDAFEKDQQELNSFASGSVGQVFDRSFHLTKLVRRLLDGMDSRTYDRMAVNAQERGDQAAVQRYQARKQTLSSAMSYTWGTLADLTASLPEYSAKDLSTGGIADPFRVLKKYFPGGQKRPIADVLKELAAVVESSRQHEPGKFPTQSSGVRDVANIAEVVRDFADVDQTAMDELFTKTWGKTEAQQNSAEAKLMSQLTNPEFNDVTKQGSATIIQPIPTDSDVRNSPQVNPQTETPQFKRWFAASKVTDAAGAPMRMYHGTSKDKPFSAFSESPRGIWFSSDPEQASSYARSNDSQKIVNEGGRYKSVNTSEQVIPVYLSLQNPLKVSGEVLKKWQSATNYRAVNRELVANAKQAGYDGLQFGDSTYVAFAPTQIKSAIGNRGTFDASKKNLTLSPKVDAISPDVRNRAVNINDEGADFTGMILRGEKTIETRDTPRSLRPFVGKRVGLVSTGKKGPAQLVGSAVVGEPKFYRTEAEFRADFDLHRVEPGSEYDIGPNGKWGYPLSEVRSLDPQPAPPGGRVARILPEGTRLSPEVQQDSEASTNPLSTPKVGETGQTQLDSPAQQAYSKPAGKGDTYGQEQPEQGRDRGRRVPRGSYAPLEGAPNVTGATGPTPGLLDVARSYAAAAGIPHRRQAVYVEVDDDRGRRIAEAYAEMKHAPRDPKVQEAYADLIRQTKDQYQALVKAGYEFTFFDQFSDPYKGNPMAAMRDLRANKRMAVYGTYDGYGTEGITGAAIQDNPMLEPTGLTWFDQQGVPHAVVANDLFRAVHDAFGHGLEGAGFRARGEENAWQAHIRLFTGPARHALTSETRGQNSWLNYGPHGDLNSTAKLKDTIFAEQKTGLMPDWTLTEGVSPDEVDETDDRRYSPQRIQRDVGRNRDFAKPPSESEAIEALHINKRSFWRGHDDLPEGTAVGVRIDIPAFTDNGVYVQTIHEAATPGNVGERIGYDTNVRLAGPVRFFVKQGSEQLKSGALAIKEGRAKKHPIATVEGNLSKDRSVPLDIEEWTPIGMDPKKHSYFYDKRTGQPVEGGSESYSVGNTVFVKDPVPGKLSDFRYSPEPVKLDPKTALQINSYNHAQQLFDRGYTLYGANNDGFDDSPNLIRTAEDIDNYDPENMVAMVPKSGDPVRNSPSVVSQEQLELNFKAAVDQLGTEAALDPAQAPGKPAKKDAPTTFSITISRIKRLLTRGPVNPVGMSAATPRDRHAIAALFRNPAFESQRWVFLKEGKVVAVSSTTVRQPNMVYTFNPYLSIDTLAATAEESGADSLFWTHNHPSGISRPSEADIRGTKIIQEKFLKGPIWDKVSFLGHIVTNHNAHHFIKPDGDIELVQVTAFHDKLLNKSIWDAPIYGPESMASAGAAMENRYNPSRMILFLDAPGYIKAVGEISPNLDAKKFAREVKKFALANGATAAVAYGSFIETDLPVFYQLVQDGILIDGYIPGVGSLRNSLQEPPPALYTAPDSMFSENQTVRRSTEKMQFSPRIEQSVDALDKLGDKNLSQVNAKTLKYPNNPAYPKSIALPSRWGLVNEKIVGMPKTSKEVSDIVVRQVDRLERVIQDMPDFAKESARFYLDMGLSSLDLASSALPGAKGLEQHKMADLMLRFLALGSPRTGVAANATKSSYSVSAAASDFTPGLKIGFGAQQRGAREAMASWKKDQPFDLNMPGIDNKVRNFYLNGLSEIIDLASANGDTASYEHLMNNVAGSLGLLKPGETLSKNDYPEVKRLLDGMATVDMWDMAAKGFAWPGYLIDPAKRNDPEQPWQWSQDKFAQDTTMGDSRWPQILKELSKSEKQKISGPEDLRYQQARALRIEGNKNWSEKTWQARLDSGTPFGPETPITVFTEGSEAGLSPGGAGPQYDAQQSIDGLVSDEINSRGLAPLFGKEKLFARNAQEILWALERLDNPVKANNELVLFGQTFKAVKEALQALQLGEKMSPKNRGNAVLDAMDRAYESMASQDIPIEVVSAGSTPEAARIQNKIAELKNAGVTDADRVVTESVAAGMMSFFNETAEKHGVKVILDNVRTGLGGYSEKGRANKAPNMVLRLRGNVPEVRRVLEVLSRSMDQDGGNIFRRPTIRELNDPKTKLNNVLTFDTQGLTPDQQWAFFSDLNNLKDAAGNSFLTGFTQTGAGLAIGDQFHKGDMVAAIDANKLKIAQVMRQHGVGGLRRERLIVDTFSRGTPAGKSYGKGGFVKDLTQRIQSQIESAEPAERQFPMENDANARIHRLIKEAVYARFEGKSKATRYFVDLASQVDVAILRDEITEEVGDAMKADINRIAKRKIAQAAEKTAKAKAESAKAKAESAKVKEETAKAKISKEPQQ